ncbi:hypothetical protein A0H81_04954 [Grifola frondosa]|uniref:Uncharacterized protein n=1 Tax=Grifola frondosa TaxID=5627 RepID=A0A1C7MG51_GRIFR|nr:hypothetical protein A0H81_04954 [Grifola frondosa]
MVLADSYPALFGFAHTRKKGVLFYWQGVWGFPLAVWRRGMHPKVDDARESVDKHFPTGSGTITYQGVWPHDQPCVLPKPEDNFTREQLVDMICSQIEESTMRIKFCEPRQKRVNVTLDDLFLLAFYERESGWCPILGVRRDRCSHKK